MGICLSTRDFLRRRTLPSWAATPTCRRDRVREASLGSTSTSRMVSLCAWVMVRLLGSALYQGHGLDLLSWTVANEAVGLRKIRTSWPSMDGHPRSRMSLAQVASEAKTLPMRWVQRARARTGMCRYAGASTISLTAAISAAVSWPGAGAGRAVVETADAVGTAHQVAKSVVTLHAHGGIQEPFGSNLVCGHAARLSV